MFLGLRFFANTHAHRHVDPAVIGFSSDAAPVSLFRLRADNGRPVMCEIVSVL